MAINPKLIKVAVKLILSKDGGKLIVNIVVGVIIILLLIICFFAYIISAPFNWIVDEFNISGEEKVEIQSVQDQYKDVIRIDKKVIDRGGKYSYPTEGTPGNRRFSEVPVKHPVLGISRPHLGLDFNTIWHSDVFSIADGQVVDVGINEEAGMYITIFHKVGQKSFFTRYLHLSGIYAFPDAEVKQGEAIGAEGGEPNKNNDQLYRNYEQQDKINQQPNSNNKQAYKINQQFFINSKAYDMFPGISTGHHLHFEVREGITYSTANPVDPQLYINPIPVKISCSSNS